MFFCFHIVVAPSACMIRVSIFGVLEHSGSYCKDTAALSMPLGHLIYVSGFLTDCFFGFYSARVRDLLRWNFCSFVYYVYWVLMLFLGGNVEKCTLFGSWIYCYVVVHDLCFHNSDVAVPVLLSLFYLRVSGSSFYGN